MMVPFASVFNREEGIWKSVVEPMLETVKRVEVALEVELPIAKSVLFVVPFSACTARYAYGDVVPMPTLAPIKVATVGLVCVEEATYAAIVPRLNIPEMPTLNPPPA